MSMLRNLEANQQHMQHIHGLGVNARTGVLYIATHTGLFQAAKDRTQVARIGDSRQDIMGFSVISAGRFIGSGHYGPRIVRIRPVRVPEKHHRVAN